MTEADAVNDPVINGLHERKVKAKREWGLFYIFKRGYGFLSFPVNMMNFMNTTALIGLAYLNNVIPVWSVYVFGVVSLISLAIGVGIYTIKRGDLPNDDIMYTMNSPWWQDYIRMKEYDLMGEKEKALEILRRWKNPEFDDRIEKYLCNT